MWGGSLGRITGRWGYILGEEFLWVVTGRRGTVLMLLLLVLDLRMRMVLRERRLPNGQLRRRLLQRHSSRAHLHL